MYNISHLSFAAIRNSSFLQLLPNFYGKFIEKLDLLFSNEVVKKVAFVSAIAFIAYSIYSLVKNSLLFSKKSLVNLSTEYQKAIDEVFTDRRLLYLEDLTNGVAAKLFLHITHGDQQFTETSVIKIKSFENQLNIRIKMNFIFAECFNKIKDKIAYKVGVKTDFNFGVLIQTSITSKKNLLPLFTRIQGHITLLNGTSSNYGHGSGTKLSPLDQFVSFADLMGLPGTPQIDEEGNLIP